MVHPGVCVQKKLYTPARVNGDVVTVDPFAIFAAIWRTKYRGSFVFVISFGQTPGLYSIPLTPLVKIIWLERNLMKIMAEQVTCTN